MGLRVRQLRLSAGESLRSTQYCSRTYLDRIERGTYHPSLAKIEQLCEHFQIGLETFFAPQERFDVHLFFGDSFVEAVRPFLKSLTEEQKRFILVTLEAAPKQKRPYARTRRAT